MSSADLVVHNRSTKVLSTNKFVLADLLCEANNFPMYFQKYILGIDPAKFYCVQYIVNYNIIWSYNLYLLSIDWSIAMPAQVIVN